MIKVVGGCILDSSMTRDSKRRTVDGLQHPRLSLMVRFLEATSCHVSEMLHAELGKARRWAGSLI